MSDNYTRRRASTRGMRTNPQRPQSANPGMRPGWNPGGPNSQDPMENGLPLQPAPQAQALRGPQPGDDIMNSIPNSIQDQLRAGYQAGGFDGVQKSVGDDWYNIPEHMRTQILAGVRK